MKELLTADNIKSIAMAVVVVLSGGSVLQGHHNGVETKTDFDETISEIHAIHGAYNESVDRQKRIEAMLKKLTGETP